MDLGIIIQARMGSTRLPGKILKKIGPKNILEHILFRLERLEHRARIVIATSTLDQDNVVEHFCQGQGIDYFRGDHENVLKRYYDCSLVYGFKTIVRLTGDDPFFDMEEIDRLIDFHFQSNADLSHSYPMLPVGVGAEIISFKALEKSFLETEDPYHLEHVDEYILQHPDIFNIAVLEVQEPKKKPDIRLTVDTQTDYQRACYIVKNTGTNYLTTQRAIQLALEFDESAETQ